MKLPKGSSDAQREKLFTFVTEHAGTTTIEQFRGSDPTQALEAWIGESIVRPEKLHPEDRSSSGVAIEGLQRVWCYSGFTESGVPLLTHFIATEGVE